MIINKNSNRFTEYHKWEKIKNSPYDYEKNGLLKHIMSNKIVNTNNRILKIILIYYEKSMVFLMNYVDILRNFKNYHWKNR